MLHIRKTGIYRNVLKRGRTIRRKTSEKPKRNYTEHALQKSFFDWLEKIHPKWRLYFHAIVNAARLTPFQGKWLKDEGKTPGVPDVFGSIPSMGKHGLYIEMKAPGEKPSAVQKEKIKLFRDIGYEVAVCDNIDSAMQVTESYMGSKTKLKAQG